jgi:GTPase SAR1 family protein
VSVGAAGNLDAAVIRKKLVIVGDVKCGKTCLLTVLTTNEFPKPEEFVPSVLENSSAVVETDGKRVL